MSRNRAWRRKKNYSKAIRKFGFLSKLYGHEELSDKEKRKCVGELIKGKAHCSCGMCVQKTNNRGNYGRAINYKHSDEMKVNSMKDQINDYKEGTTYEND